MTDRDWERELAEIDRRLASTPDPAPDPPVAARRAAPAQLPPAARTASPPVPSASTAGGVGSSGSDVSARAAGRSVGTPAAPGRRSWRAQVALLFRLALGAAVVAALVYWPYPAACGAGLAVYLGLVAALGLAGLGTSTSAWRHRAPFVHVLGLAMITAAAVLGAREVLPRVGYAVPVAGVPATWQCAP